MGWLTRLPTSWRGERKKSRVAAGLDYARQPEPGWQEALDAETLTGDGSQVARLFLAWVPGDPWQPVHRWFLFQLQPWAFVRPDVRKELRGPHPRTGASLEWVPRVVDGKVSLRPHVRGGPCRMIDRMQWSIHRHIERSTGTLVFPRYAWVVQGEDGGHPFMAGAEEQALRKAQGLPDVPSAGDLPYAPFDQRVLSALRSYDLWRYAHGLGDPMTAYASATIARQTANEREANKLVWGRKEAVAGMIANEMAFNARKDGLHYHRWNKVGEKAPVVDYERMRDAYINDTTFA